MSDNIMPMAWNEPGSGGKKENPWGDKGNKGSNNDGPPDLDEIFRKIKNQIKALFGVKSTGGPGISKKNSELGIFIIIGVIVIGYFIFGFYTVSSYEQGVITRLGKYNHTVSPGLHWAPPLVDDVQIVNTENIKSSRHSGWMLTKDENIVSVEMEVQYRVIDAEKYLFNVTDPDGTLTQAGDSALRQVIGDSFTDDVLTDKKQQIAEAVKDQLVAILEKYDAGFHIEAVNFRDSRPPEEVKEAFDDVTKSREDKERLKLQAEAYSNTIIPEAEGAAKKAVAEAEAYRERVVLDAVGETQRFNLILPGYQKSPQVTKTRMYLEAMQEVMNNTTKVVVNGNAGNNLIYLPLDKMMDKSRLDTPDPNATPTLVVPQAGDMPDVNAVKRGKQ
jgi:membrane protease subunit HflK